MSARTPPGPPARRFIRIDNKELERAVCGPVHSHLQFLEQTFADEQLRAESQGGGILLTGGEEGVRRAADVIEAFMARIQSGADANLAELQATIATQKTSAQGVGREAISGLRKSVMAQTPGQQVYLETLRDETKGLVFGIGPAGTGKTFLAVAVGAAALRAGRFERLVVARPAVEAGERLGFLPGDLEEKVDPYMLPIWDALNDCLGAAEVDRRKERKEIEVAPLAFMRGRTLKNAFVVIDEAQNATIAQMKMVLTRLGRGSRMAVTGDPSQTDLPDRTPSGLAHALEVLDAVPGVAVHRLNTADVVRHELVGRIIEAYDRHGASPAAGFATGDG